MTFEDDSLLHHAISQAEAYTQQCELSPFSAARETGNVLIKNGVVVPELTQKGVRESSVIIPVVNTMFLVTEFIASQPVIAAGLDTIGGMIAQSLDLDHRTSKETVAAMQISRTFFAEMLTINRDAQLGDESIVTVGPIGVVKTT